jgi:hypothetical protein
MYYGLNVLATVVCLSSAALATCPAGTRPSIDGCIDGSARARVRSVRSETQTERPRAKLPAPDDKLRVLPSAPRELDRIRYSLLILELQRLEQVLQVTPRKAPDRPILLRRLAEGYAELAALAERTRAQAEIRAERGTRQPSIMPGPASGRAQPGSGPRRPTLF